jgi:asparagine synthase (glutamine-hydrolysing)
VLRYARQDYLDAFEQFAHGAEQPMADPAIPPTLLSLSHCRKHFDAVLDGSGVEESFGMMPPRHVRMGVEYAALLPAHLRLALAGAMRRLPGLSDYAPIFDFEHPAELMLRWHGFTRPEIESLCGQPVSFEHTFFYQTFWRFPRQAHYERYSALLGALTCDRLHHAAAITGMPVHYPYMNRDVDSYIKALPVNYRYLPGEPKRLLRALLARYVPREILDAPKHGFDFPLMTFLDAEDFELVRRYLRHGRWEQHALLSPRKVEDLGRRYMAGERHLMFRVWALVMLSAWLEGHGY